MYQTTQKKTQFEFDLLCGQGLTELLSMHFCPSPYTPTNVSPVGTYNMSKQQQQQQQRWDHPITVGLDILDFHFIHV